MRNKLLIVLLLGVAIVLVAQTTYQVPVWIGNRYIWPTLGPTLRVSNGVLDAVVPSASPRIYDAALAEESGRYKLPLGASRVTVHLNGLRQASGIDYRIESGAVVPMWPWPSGVVLCDYDKE